MVGKMVYKGQKKKTMEYFAVKSVHKLQCSRSYMRWACPKSDFFFRIEACEVFA
jgi:hypothetical protein